MTRKIERMDDCYNSSSQQPAAVDGAMVERGVDAAITSSTQRYRGESARDSWRRLVRDVLTAALAAQPTAAGEPIG